MATRNWNDILLLHPFKIRIHCHIFKITATGQTAKKWTKRWFELQFQSAKSYFFVFMFKMVIFNVLLIFSKYFLFGQILQHKLHHIQEKFCHVLDGFSLVCFKNNLFCKNNWEQSILYQNYSKKSWKGYIFRKYYTDLMAHASWSMAHLLEYGQVFMSCMWRYLLIPLGLTGLFNPLRSYT